MATNNMQASLKGPNCFKPDLVKVLRAQGADI
jgi:hypothetical protein